MNKNETIEELKEQIKDFEKLTWELRKDAGFKEKEFNVRAKEIRLDGDKERLEQEKKIARGEARLEGMKAQLNESPYSLLQDILKALVVKLPTLDIKELSVSSKEK